MNLRVQELFHGVADLTTDERTRYFAQHSVDEEARREVEALLEFDSGASGTLERDIGLAAGRALTQIEASGRGRCGPYRLLDVLGRGGMGAVYLAERVDGEVTQRVAIKLLGAGSGDPQRRERFLQERQILASLAHPNIARLLDAGHLDDGQPFLAMEYVEGKPIDVFAAGLGVRRKIALFLKVCAAVGYLHRSLVVHRDLKPSNILVTAEGEPKLLDFGIAKILDLSTDSTVTGMRMLTPDYASPEQVTGGRVSTATDTYSLGAVLYWLLTGKPAHEFADHSPEAIASAVTKREVTRPSKWAPELKGDLEFILLKALRKDPQERYATVEQFAEDLEAFLQSRPVRARSGNAWYHARKFLRRYWAPVAAATLVIASLSAGLYIANRERLVAERRFGQLRRLSNKVFDLDKAIRDLPGSTQARQSLVSVSLEYLEGLTEAARGDLDLAREIGQGYWRVGRIQGVPVELNLGERTKAEASLKKAAEFIERVLAARPKDRGALYLSALIANDRMILAIEEHRSADALAHAHESAGRLDAFLRPGDAREAELAEAASRYGNIAVTHVSMHLYEEAIPYARREQEIAKSIPSARIPVNLGLISLANAFRQGDLEGALQVFQEARKAAETAVYPSQTMRINDLFGMLLREGLILGGDGEMNLGRPADAIHALQKAFELEEEAARKDPVDATSRAHAAKAGIALANILRHENPRRALAVYDVALRRLSEIRNSLPAQRDRALALANSSYALRSLARAFEAGQRIDTALAILKDTKDYPAEQYYFDSAIYTVLCAQADHETEVGDPRRAVETYEQLLDKAMAAKAVALTDLEDAPRLSRLYEALTRLYRRTGDPAKAESMLARRVELWQHWDRKLPNNAFVRRQIEAASR